MSGRPSRERLYCYECEDQWDRAQDELRCPRCNSEFVEVRSPRPASPVEDPPEMAPLFPYPSRDFSSTIRDPTLLNHNRAPAQHRHPLANHNPWAAPDPDDDDISSFSFSSRGPGGGTIHYSSRTWSSINGPGGTGRTVRSGDPAANEVLNDFSSMFHNLMGVGHRQQQPTFVGGSFRLGGGMRSPGGPPRPGFYSPPRETPQDPFAAILSTLSAHGPQTGGNASGPPDITGLLQVLLNATPGFNRDGVHTQEEFDRVMSQLMEQDRQNGAPPAAEELISRLPRKKVDNEMMGSDGMAECSICIDSVVVGTEVAVLPCGHWFHFDCIESWLKEHDTCPCCRKPITPESDDRSQVVRQVAPSGPEPPRLRRSSNLNRAPRPRPQLSFRVDSQPIEVSGGPPITSRPARRTNSDLGSQRSYRTARRTSSLERTDTADGGRSSSRSEHNNRPANSGVGGWIRNHMPF